MAETTYSYLLAAFPNNKAHVGKLEQETQESDIVVSLRSITADDTVCDFLFKDVLSTGDVTILGTVVSGHDGSGLDFAQTVTLTDSAVSLEGEFRDKFGKLRVHQTSRKPGLRTVFTGVGDDPTDVNKVGGGTPLTVVSVSGTTSTTQYVDFNIVKNETWLQQGYMTWHNANFDILIVEIVPRTVDITTSSGTNYKLHGPMIIPAAGDGTVSINSDLTTHSGGLIYMPNNELDEPPTAFWNADWNNDTDRYGNITPAPYGDGRYNMFPNEIVLAKFLNKMSLLNSGSISLNPSDTDSLGHGMRLKITSTTNTSVAPHDWGITFMMCLYRNKSI